MPYGKQRPWGTVKPATDTRLDYSAIPFHSLVDCAVFPGGSTQIFNLAGPVTFAINTLTPTLGIGAFGAGIVQPTGTGNIYATSSGRAAVGASLIVVLNAFVGGGTRTIFSVGSAGNYFGLDSSNRPVCFFASAARATGVAITRPTVLGFCGKANDYRVYQDGAQTGSGSAGAGSFGSISSMGGQAGIASQGVNMAAFIYWNGINLSDAVMRQLTRDPFAMLVAPRRRVVSSVAGGASIPIGAYAAVSRHFIGAGVN